MNDYPKHRAALASALQDVGVQETKDKNGRGTNTGPRIIVYQHATWMPGTRWPWCCAFVLYHWLHAGLKTPYLGAGAYKWHEWAGRQGWVVTADKAVPGDAVVFNVGSGHMAMLRLPVKNGVVETVDGNVSDSVDLRARPLGMVRGFIHIPETPVVLEPVTPPTFEVVGSVSGHKKVVFTGSRSKVGKWISHTPIQKRYGGITVRRRKG